MRVLSLISLLLLLGCTDRGSISGFYEDRFGYSPIEMTIDNASAMVGLNERKHRRELKAFLGVDPVAYQWCAAFVNAHLHLNGIPGSETVSENPLLARSFLQWGYEVDQPQYGDIVVFPRGNQGWQGHVGFYISSVNVRGVEYYIILGGNQDNSVSYEYYRASRAIGIRRLHPDESDFLDIDQIQYDTLLAYAD